MPAPTSTRPRLGHQSSLDGLRGIAVAVVLIFHLGWNWLPGGFFGVDVFFVLSGFLITTLLLEEHIHAGRISLGTFFYRRMIRLYPALIGLVAFSTFFTLVAHRETGVGRALSIASSVLFYYANWLSMVDTAGWFGGMPHTWSLAIEGQFYLLWALIVAGLARRHATPEKRSSLLKILLVIAGGIVVASTSWRASLWSEGVTWLRPYLGTDTRLDGLFLGAIIALVRLQHAPAPPEPATSRASHWAYSLLGTVSVGAIAYLVCTVQFGSALPYYLGFTFVSLASATLLFSLLRDPETFWARLLRWPALVWLGKISYSLYIWHVPVLKVMSPQRLTSVGLPLWVAEAARLLVSLVVATASYYLIERTCLRLKKRLE